MMDRLVSALRLAVFTLLSAVSIHQSVFAEPYLAVQKGLKCGVCHTSPTGGGKRTVYGNVYAQTEVSERTLDLGELWKGELGKYFAVGGDIRGGWNQIDVPGQPRTSETDLQEFLAYVDIRPFAKYLMIYIDAKLAPDDPIVREQYLRLSTADNNWTLRGGEFFLPYGLRIQDDDAFIRQVSGINFNTPDTGWELGFERNKWSA